MKTILVTAFLILVLFAGAVSAQDTIEKKKIEFLLSTVENLQGAKFIRNGIEYDGKQAVVHIRMKLEQADGKVHTANDFIRLCASKSYIMGKPYNQENIFEKNSRNILPLNIKGFHAALSGTI